MTGLNGHGAQPAQPNVPPVDPGHGFLSEGPSALSTHVVATPSGPRLILTIRTSSTTLTVLLARDDALNWARAIRNEAQGISSLIVPPGALN